MRNFKGVVFDLDNTLYPEVAYFRMVIRQLPSSIAGDEEKVKMVDQFESLRMNSNDILGDLLRVTGNYSKKNKDRFFEIYRNPDRKEISLYPSAKSILRQLYTKKIKMGVLTNGVVPVQQSKVDCLGVRDFFDAIVFARREGPEKEKPAPWSFNQIVDELSLAFEDILFIGDNPETDFQVPAARGAVTVRMLKGPHRHKEAGPNVDKVITEFAELKQILDIE